MHRVSMTALCSVFIACTAASNSAADQSDKDITLGEVESTLEQCGIGCPAGNHAASFECSFNCGSCLFNNNQTICESNNGTFLSCGTCPAGWHPTRFMLQLACNISLFSTSADPNQSVCEPNSGSFLTCGGCPPGWHATSTLFDPGCNISAFSTSTNPNKSVCAPN